MEGKPQMSTGIGRVSAVCIDVNDIHRAATFWGSVLGLEPKIPRGGWVRIGDFTTTTRLILQLVPEGKVIKNRVHLDLDVDDVDVAAASVEALGGSIVEERDDGSGRFYVMKDPDGNEFCITRDTSRS